MPLDENAPQVIGGHGYSVGMQTLFLRLVLAGISLRGVERVLQILADVFGGLEDVPHWTTGRLWLLRLGHAMLTAPKNVEDDWAWLIDHSVQIGQEKCLAIMGLRLRDLPAPEQCLQHTDLQLIALMPSKSWTQEEVDQALEAATEQTGVPRVIVTDHGVDIHGGVSFFQARHPETLEIYDTKHKAACLLKSRLEKNPRWQAFQAKLGQTRCAIQQTELGFLVPPGLRTKARFMNLESILEWAQKTLSIVQCPSAAVLQLVRPERLQEKLGWLPDFAADIAEWHEWQTIITQAVTFVGREGIYRGVAGKLRAVLPRATTASAASLINELVAFEAQQALRLRVGERFPASTEVLESCFGRFKQLEKQQARGGFTTLLLGFGAMIAEATTTVIAEAMQRSRTKHVFAWCKEHLGTTMFGQRKLAFAAASATEPG